MSEISKRPAFEIPPPGTERLGTIEEVSLAIIKECWLEVIKPGEPTRGDYNALAFSRCLGGLLMDQDADCRYFQDVFNYGVDLRMQEGRDIKPSQLKGLTLRIFQHLMLFKFKNFDYPWEKFNRSQIEEGAATWKTAILEIVKDPDGFNEFTKYMQEQDTTTNIYKRARPLYLALLCFQEQLRELDEKKEGKPLRLLEIGASRNKILKTMAMGMPLGGDFKITEFMPDPNVPAVVIDDGRLTEGARHMFKRKLKLGECLGSDRVPLDDEDAKRWAFSSSHYPIDLFDVSGTMRYRRIDEAEVPNVGFAQFDPLKEELPPEYHHAYDAVICSTMWHQVPKEERPKLEEEVKRYLDPEGLGLLLVTDFAVVDPVSGDIIPLDYWYVEPDRPFPYAAIMKNMFEPGAKPEVYMEFTNSRCEEGRLVGKFGQALARSMITAQRAPYRVGHSPQVGHRPA
jgi:hypothetical protein